MSDPRADATLIMECLNETCRGPQSDRDGERRNCFGRREWTADFNLVEGDEGTSYYAAVDDDDLRCPECDERGVVFAY